MNKYLTSFLIFLLIFIMEAIPFLYKDSYSFEDMKWGWIIALPLVFLIRDIYMEKKQKK